MNNLLVELGLFLIAPVEKLSHALQWLTGKDNFAQAKLLTYATQFFYCVSSSICVFKIFILEAPALFIIGCLAGVTYLLAWMFGPCYRIEITKAEKRIQVGFRNPLQVCPGDSWIRLVWSLLSFVVCIRSGLYAPALISHTLCTYLRACTPLPPRPILEEALPESTSA